MYSLADATHSMDQGGKIVDGLLLKLQSPAFEWRRIIKSLNAVDFILKNGSPNVFGKIQMNGSSLFMAL
jgi:hypothetical protein